MKGTERKVKLYPFSGTKHAHDIDFRRSRVKNELAEAIQLKGSRLVCVISDEEYAALENLEERLDDLIGYVPDGEMIGKITEKEDYSTAQGKMQVSHPNSFFEEAFGRNDFEELNDMEMRSGNAVSYLLKYISKTGERIVYSRGIRSEICMKLPAREIATHMFDYVQKFVLFDDTVNWERDIMHYEPKQISILDLLSRSPQVA